HAALVALSYADRNAQTAQCTVIAPLRSRHTLLDWIDGALLPLAFILASTSSAGGLASRTAVYAAAIGAFTVFSWRQVIGGLRDAGAAAAILTCMILVAERPPADV